MSDETAQHVKRPTGAPALVRDGAASRRGAGDDSDDSIRSVLVLESDALARAQMEGLLRDEGYWVVGTSDAKAAQKLLRVGAADLVLADPREAVLAPVPRWARRRTDLEKPLPKAFFEEGYAVLRALDVDPAAAEYPMVILKDAEPGPDGASPARFGVVGYVPRGIGAESVIECLEGAYRTLVKLRRAAELPPRSGLVDEPQVRVATRTPPGAAKAESGIFASLPKALRKALVVDPDASSRRLVRKALDKHDVTVFEAADAKEALRLALSARPWLILSEVNLPGKDGFDFCAEVRGNRLLRHTPLIFISERDGYADRAHGLKLGADDYLNKPLRVRELLIRVQLTLQRYSDLRFRTRNGPGMDGEIEIIGAPSVLQMCHISQFTGIFTSHDEARRAQIRFRDGEMIGAENNGRRGAEAVYAFLGWTKGHFEFVSGDPGPGESFGESFDQIILEGCRRLDEAGREEPASRQRTDVSA
jgi:DNA-binding response OmpR family regulator